MFRRADSTSSSSSGFTSSSGQPSSQFSEWNYDALPVLQETNIIPEKSKRSAINVDDPWMESFLKTLRRGLVRKQPTKPAKANDEVLEERANRRPVEAALLDTSISGAEAKTFLGGCDHCNDYRCTCEK
jgi:hypothetical protein